MIVCVVPRDLERKLAGRLSRALAGTDVHIVVERRTGDERRARERRTSAGRERRMLERRRVLAADGRRVADRRAPAVPVEPPSLPWRLRAHAERVAFVAPLEPPAELAEDVHAARAVIRWQAGDAVALRDLYLTWFDRAYAFAQVSLGEAGAATDAVQEAFSAAYEGLDQLDPTRASFRAFLFAEVLAAVRATLVEEPVGAAPRDAARRSAAATGDPSALRWVNDRELVLLVRRLPAREREALLLRFVGGLNHADIADLLDLGWVVERSLADAGLGRLRERLAELGGAVEASQREAMRRLAQPSAVLNGRKLALLSG
jgi:RNA polymerase sigma factor (sigma-70 family)